MSSIYGNKPGGNPNPRDSPFGYHTPTVPMPQEFLRERLRVIQLMTLFPFAPRRLIKLPEDYTTHTAPMLWGPYHQQSKNHRAKYCYTCTKHFTAYPDEEEFFAKMIHEPYKHHNYRKYRFHSLTYTYVIYHHAGFNMQNHFVRASIIDAFHKNSTSKRRIGFRSLELNPHFGALRKMYNDELIRRMGHDPEEIEKAVFDRVLDMAIPEHRGNGEIMKTDSGKRAALSTLAYLALPEVHTAIKEGELTQQTVRIEEGDKAMEIPIGYARPSLPSGSEAKDNLIL